MILYKNSGKILGKHYEVEIYGDTGIIINHKSNIRQKKALQKPFDDFYAIAESIQWNNLVGSPKLLIKLQGPPHYFYFFLRKVQWYFDSTNLEFECNFTEKEYYQGSDFLITKMTNYVLSFTKKNMTEFSYLFCEECNPPKSSIHIPNKPNVDIVIPVKNTNLRDLKKCLMSLDTEIEILDKVYIVDDNEKSELGPEMFKDFRFSVEIIRGSVNGVGAARNIGAKMGLNPLVLFVDSDDYVLPGFVSRQRIFHEKHSEVGASGTWLQAFGDHERIYPQWDNISPLSVLSCLPPAGVLMWKRAALEDLDFFNPSFQLGFEDFDLVARATVRKIPIIILDEVLYRYRRGHSSLSQNWNAGQEIELRNAVNDNLRKLCHHDFKVFLELNSKFGPSIFQSNPDFIFVKQKEIMFNIISTLSIAFYLLPKNLRKFIFRLIRKFFPFSLNYIIKPHEISSIINRLRKNKLLTKIWQKLPNRFKLFFFRKFFPQI